MCIQLDVYNNSIIICSFDLICVGPSWVNYWMIIPSRIKHRLRKMRHFPSKLGCLGLLEHRKHQILNQSHSSWTKKPWKIPLNPLKLHSFPLKTHHFYPFLGLKNHPSIQPVRHRPAPGASAAMRTASAACHAANGLVLAGGWSKWLKNGPIVMIIKIYPDHQDLPSVFLT